MLRILVVDDEPRQRRILSQIIRTYQPDDEVCEAKNGQEALALHRQKAFDIIFCDIRMPLMDGLDLIRAIRAFDDRTQIVILSGYAEFSYAQQAIALEVFEYLLKPVEEEQVGQTLENMQARIETRKEEEHKIDAARALHERECLSRILSGHEDAETLCEVNSILPQTHKIMALRFHWGRGEMLSAEDVYHTVHTRLLKKEQIALFHEPDAPQAIAFIGMEQAEESPEIHFFLRAVLTELSETMRGGIWAGCSESFETCPEGIRQAVRQAQVTLAASFYRPECLLHEYSQVSDKVSEKIQRYPRGDDAIFQAIFQEEANLPLLVEHWTAEMTGGEWAPPDLLLSAMKSALLQHHHALSERFSLEEDPQFSTDHLQTLGECKTLEQTNVWLCEYFSDVQKKLSGQLKNRHQLVINRCLERMEKDFSPQLSLKMVADWCHFSPSHFSVLFKQHTGKTFLEHLIALRISKSCELLRGTKMKVYEVAREVGFRDVKHFAKVFRKVQSASPDEFRSLGATAETSRD